MLDTTGKHPLFVFGGGARICPGACLAQLEIFLIVSNFVKCFQFELVDKSIKEVTMKNLGMFSGPIYQPMKFKPRCDIDKLVGA